MFDEQWRDVERTVLSEVKRQMLTAGGTDPRRLSKLLQQEVGQWQSGRLAYGAMMNEFRQESESRASEFLTKVSELRFCHEKSCKLPSPWPCHLVVFFLALVVFFLIEKCVDTSLFHQLVYTGIVATISALLLVPWRMKRKNKGIERILSDYKRQLDEMKAQLIKIMID